MHSIGARVSITIQIVFSMTFQHEYFSGSTRNRAVILWKARNCAMTFGSVMVAQWPRIGWWNADLRQDAEEYIWNLELETASDVVMNFEK